MACRVIVVSLWETMWHLGDCSIIVGNHVACRVIVVSLWETMWHVG